MALKFVIISVLSSLSFSVAMASSTEGDAAANHTDTADAAASAETNDHSRSHGGTHGGSHSDGHSGKEYLNFYPSHKPVKAKTQMPPAVIIEQPKPFEKISSSSVVLKWAPQDQTQNYHLQIAKDPQFKWLIVEKNPITAHQFELDLTPDSPEQIFWRVAPLSPSNDNGYTKGPFSASSFEITLKK